MKFGKSMKGQGVQKNNQNKKGNQPIPAAGDNFGLIKGHVSQNMIK